MLIDIHNNNKLKMKPKCITKWNEIYQNENLVWEKIFSLPYNICRNTKLQSFQYRVLHRTITCNHWLFITKIKQDPNCDICQLDDTLSHFFVQCNQVKYFWTALNRWWNRSTPTQTTYHNISELDIIFGIFNSEKYTSHLNFIILLAKKYIHDCKMTTRPISFFSFLVLVRQELNFEKEICLGKGCEANFTFNWILEQL